MTVLNLAVIKSRFKEWGEGIKCNLSFFTQKLSSFFYNVCVCVCVCARARVCVCVCVRVFGGGVGMDLLFLDHATTVLLMHVSPSDC